MDWHANGNGGEHVGGRRRAADWPTAVGHAAKAVSASMYRRLVWKGGCETRDIRISTFLAGDRYPEVTATLAAAAAAWKSRQVGFQ